MSGTSDGGKQLVITMIEKYGSEEAWRDHMRKIGSQGGKNGSTGGFAYSKRNGLNWHIEAGRVGGKISKPHTKKERPDDTQSEN